MYVFSVVSNIQGAKNVFKKLSINNTNTTYYVCYYIFTVSNLKVGWKGNG